MGIGQALERLNERFSESVSFPRRTVLGRPDSLRRAFSGSRDVMGLFQLRRRAAGCLGSDAAMPSPIDNPTCCASCSSPACSLCGR